jgi:hypothetical protein
VKFRVKVGDAFATMYFEWVGHADDVPGAVASAWRAARVYCPSARDDHGPFSFEVKFEGED